jgi:hypothetical protein
VVFIFMSVLFIYKKILERTSRKEIPNNAGAAEIRPVHYINIERFFMTGLSTTRIPPMLPPRSDPTPLHSTYRNTLLYRAGSMLRVYRATLRKFHSVQIKHQPLAYEVTGCR